MITMHVGLPVVINLTAPEESVGHGGGCTRGGPGVYGEISDVPSSWLST